MAIRLLTVLESYSFEMFESMVKYIINDLLEYMIRGLAGTQWYHLILLLLIRYLA